jgi:hypothetical protein
MVGVVFAFGSDIKAIRTLRNDVLDCMYGKAASGLKRLLDTAVEMIAVAYQTTGSIESSDIDALGVKPGKTTTASVHSVNEVLRVACIIYSSLGNLDKLDEMDESDTPLPSEVNKRFVSEVRDEIKLLRTELVPFFNRETKLLEHGQNVRFGFISSRSIAHFTVLHPVRFPASIRDARARIFELDRAKRLSDFNRAALIAAVPRSDDATISVNQRNAIESYKREIEGEADSVGLRWIGVSNAKEGADRIVELAAS